MAIVILDLFSCLHIYTIFHNKDSKDRCDDGILNPGFKSPVEYLLIYTNVMSAEELMLLNCGVGGDS